MKRYNFLRAALVAMTMVGTQLPMPAQTESSTAAKPTKKHHKETAEEIQLREMREALKAQQAQINALKKIAKLAEEKLAKLTAEQKKVEATLADPSIYQPHRMGDMISAKTRFSDIARDIKAAEAAWLEAEEALEAAGS